MFLEGCAESDLGSGVGTNKQSFLNSSTTEEQSRCDGICEGEVR